MNTSFRFLILTIFIALGFITSCNDDPSFTEEKKTIVNNTDIASTETSSTDSTSSTEPPPYDADEIDKINPEKLSREIKEIGEKIETLEKESTKNFNEYTQMAESQKRVLENIKTKKMIMRSKAVGSEEQKRAQRDFEDEKRFGKEKLKGIKEKNIILNKIIRTIIEAKKEKEKLEKKQEYFLKRQKEKEKEKEKKKLN
ncbi:hypothetical protein [Blattabacterium cuenoti]|uniref:hypothetical protein n=1 Tax=Blattabacterium cuenoti TaxID=1653831 RepID=UPI00311EC132